MSIERLKKIVLVGHKNSMSCVAALVLSPDKDRNLKREVIFEIGKPQLVTEDEYKYLMLQDRYIFQDYIEE